MMVTVLHLRSRCPAADPSGLSADAQRMSTAVCRAVQVHPDGRRAYIGEESDRTRNGETIMTHNKSFKSLPIRSWTGGAKVQTPALTPQTCAQLFLL